MNFNRFQWIPLRRWVTLLVTHHWWANFEWKIYSAVKQIYFGGDDKFWKQVKRADHYLTFSMKRSNSQKVVMSTFCALANSWTDSTKNIFYSSNFRTKEATWFRGQLCHGAASRENSCNTLHHLIQIIDMFNWNDSYLEYFMLAWEAHTESYSKW